jgi:hypothetical protein
MQEAGKRRQAAAKAAVQGRLSEGWAASSLTCLEPSTANECVRAAMGGITI